MTRKKFAFHEKFADLCSVFPAPGAFLCVEDRKGRRNLMTIGWASLGVVWSEPVLEVLVRPSRHTFGLMEDARSFSVNVPLKKLQRKLAFCGTKSGRDLDKFEECGLMAVPGLTKGVNVIDGCDLFYECEIVHKARVIKADLDPKIIKKYYPGEEDFHTIYAGRILASYSA